MSISRERGVLKILTVAGDWSGSGGLKCRRVEGRVDEIRKLGFGVIFLPVLAEVRGLSIAWGIGECRRLGSNKLCRLGSKVGLLQVPTRVLQLMMAIGLDHV